MSRASTQEFEKCVSKKLELLSDLLECGQRQRQIVSEGDGEKLLQLLAEKQTKVDAFVQLQPVIDGLEKQVKKSDWQSEQTRSRCVRQIAECNKLGAQLLALEQECEEVAAAHQRKVSEQMKEFARFDSSSTSFEPHLDETRLAEFDESS